MAWLEACITPGASTHRPGMQADISRLGCDQTDDDAPMAPSQKAT